MKTTFRQIKSFYPCTNSWAKLYKNTFANNSMDLDREITILEILNSNGVIDAFWAFRTQEYKDYCLINADVAETVLHKFESIYPNDMRPRVAIDCIRKWNNGKITADELKTAAIHSAAASFYASAINATASFSASAAYSAAHNAAYGSAASEYAVYSAFNTFDAAKQWKINEQILRKHLEVKK